MDAMMQLALSVEREDKARAELYKAQGDTSNLVRDNLPKLLDSGMVKVEVNRVFLRKLLMQDKGIASHR